MPSIIEYLPAIPSNLWELYRKVILPSNPLIIGAGQTDVSLMPSTIVDQRGLFSQFHLSSSSGSLIFTATLDNTVIEGTFDSLADAGLVGYYVPGIPWLSNDGTTDKLFVMNLNFNPYLPFFRNLSLNVTNPTDAPVTIIAMEVDAYIFHPGFYTALAKVISGKN